MKFVLWFALFTLATTAFGQPPATHAPAAQPGEDLLLRAMREEMERSRQLRTTGLEMPYFIEYKVEDQEAYSIGASLGGLLTARQTHLRVPSVQIRVGNYDLDNTNHLYTGAGGGSRYDQDTWPLDDNLSAFRQNLWLATDRAYKSAVEGYSIKKEILKQTNVTDPLPDFYRAQAVTKIVSGKRSVIDGELWKARSARVSAVFAAYPEIMTSGVEFEGLASMSYYMNSEGSMLRYPDTLTSIRIRAATQAPDGMALRDAAMHVSFEASKMAPEADLIHSAEQVGNNLRALVKAPVGETYSGPVLIEPMASAQFLGYLLGENIHLSRKPLAEAGRTVPFSNSEFDGKIGSRVLPDWFDVVDDPTQTEFRGHTLAGYYLIDNDGVPPKPVSVIEQGVLKEYLRSRLPIKGFQDSTGHGRLLAGFGANLPVMGNLFIRARQTKKLDALKQQLIATIQQRNKPYGILIRKLDYPSTASHSELQAMITAMVQSGGGGRPVPYPTLVYKIYPDGREELVRGLRFRGVSTRSLRDIMAASEEVGFFDFVNNGGPFAMMGSQGYLAAATVVAPGLLFEELELERAEGESQKVPIVPPPTLTVAVPRKP
jgi:TldD protein